MTDAIRPAARILVVDDDDGAREAVCEALGELGYDTEPVSGAAEALDRFRPGRYDLVVTDLVMPFIDGLELARRLRALAPGLPIMIFSGIGQDAEAPPDVGGLAIARKPDIDGLLDLVRRALGRP